MVFGADVAYVIHLDRHKLRKKVMDDLSKTIELPLNYIQAIDNQDYLDNPQELTKYLNNEWWDPCGWLTLGIIACALSHRKAYKEFLDSNHEVALFLEDDIYYTRFLRNYNYTEVRNELNNLDWGVCFYGKYWVENIKIGDVTDNLVEPEPVSRLQTAAHAYLLNRKSAEWFYNNILPLKYPADIRLEISPFKQLALKHSVFKQYNYKYYVEMDKTVPNELMCFTGEDLFEHESDYEKIQRNLDWRDRRLNISPFIDIDGYEHQTRLFGEFKRDGHLIKVSQK